MFSSNSKDLVVEPQLTPDVNPKEDGRERTCRGQDGETHTREPDTTEQDPILAPLAKIKRVSR